MSFNITILIGSMRNGRVADKVAARLSAALQAQSHTVTLIDPLSKEHEWMQVVKQPFHHSKEPTSEQVASQKLIADSDAVIALTPEYNWGPSPSILAMLDNFYRETWGGKVAGIVTYGGQSAGGARAAFVLRNVLAELHTVAFHGQFSLPACYRAFKEDGEFAEERNQENLDKFVAEFAEFVAKHK